MGIEFPSVDVASTTGVEEERDVRVSLEQQNKYLVGGSDLEPHKA